MLIVVTKRDFNNVPDFKYVPLVNVNIIMWSEVTL